MSETPQLNPNEAMYAAPDRGPHLHATERIPTAAEVVDAMLSCGPMTGRDLMKRVFRKPRTGKWSISTTERK